MSCWDHQQKQREIPAESTTMRKPLVNVYITIWNILEHIPFLMGKLTNYIVISTGPFSSSQTVTNYQKVNLHFPMVFLVVILWLSNSKDEFLAIRLVGYPRNLEGKRPRPHQMPRLQREPSSVLSESKSSMVKRPPETQENHGKTREIHGKMEVYSLVICQNSHGKWLFSHETL